MSNEINVDSVIKQLETFLENPSKISELDEKQKIRLLKATGRFSLPYRGHSKHSFKKLCKNNLKKKKICDKGILNMTGIRSARASASKISSSKKRNSSTEGPGILTHTVHCYICKTYYQKVHFFYDRLCESCAVINYRKRYEMADLTGRVAMVTGGRVKIGYEICLKLLRCGARVVMTTRFPHDACKRYSGEDDFENWKDRLEIFGLDLRHTPSVERFIVFLYEHLPRLDFIIHNACQTVRKPAGFYKHLMDFEKQHKLDIKCKSILGKFSESASDTKLTMNCLSAASADSTIIINDATICSSSADLSQLALLPEDTNYGQDVFPPNQLDEDQQQIDLRSTNSWRYKLADVSTIELIEVQLVNAIAPFVLNAQLKQLMMKTNNADKHIIHVSAVEGQFYRKNKTDRHPHTNMAKAALNMMTRTSASDYVQCGIHMNSVDTGWVSEENPVHIAKRKKDQYNFQPPLDIIDGAARVLDPIISGYNTGEHQCGYFFKDYKPTQW